MEKGWNMGNVEWGKKEEQLGMGKGNRSRVNGEKGKIY